MGSGCPDGTVQTSLREDGAFQMSFSQFNTNTTDALRRASVSCTIKVQVHMPPQRRAKSGTLAVEGTTAVQASEGEAVVVLRAGMAGETRPATFYAASRDSSGLFTHQAPISEPLPGCGSEASLKLSITVIAERDTNELGDTSAQLDRALVLPLELAPCEPAP
jgi:hypothetical protein